MQFADKMRELPAGYLLFQLGGCGTQITSFKITLHDIFWKFWLPMLMAVKWRDRCVCYLGMPTQRQL